jgi:L-ascorbate metabolism protein UlaG (beta-lactamase superfamily)
MTIRITWWGHATVLVTDRARILTDPLLTGSLVHLHRRAGLVPEEVGRHLDAVVISHLHADHLHLPSLSLLAPGTRVLLPRGGAPLLRGLPVTPVEVVAGDVIEVAGARVEVVPAVHAATRWPGGRLRGEPVGFVITGEGSTYFAGDTTSFAGMATLHPSLDVALLPVGGWGPWLRGHHLDAEEAAACLPGLGAATAIPIHYGTFWPRGLGWLRGHVFHEPGREFAAHARAAAPTTDVRVLAPGTSTEVVPGGGEDPR